MKFKFNLKYHFFIALILLCFNVVSYADVVKAEQLTDPTKPEGVSQSTSEVSYTLSAIIKNNNINMVVIDGKLLQVGDYFADVKVVSIGANEVVLEGPNGKFTLTLLTSPIIHKR